MNPQENKTMLLFDFEMEQYGPEMSSLQTSCNNASLSMLNKKDVCMLFNKLYVAY